MEAPLSPEEENELIVQSSLEMLEIFQGVVIGFGTWKVQCLVPDPYNFNVFPMDEDGDPLNALIFKIQETAGCCARYCCHPRFRPCELELSNIKFGPFMKIIRPFFCSFICINRPEVECYLTEGGQNTYIGKVTNPTYICDMGVSIFDRVGTLKYIIEGEWCQPGFICRFFCCESCSVMFIDIKSPSGEVLSKITQNKSCAKKSGLQVQFPPLATPEDKSLIIAAIMFLFYEYINYF